MTFTDLTNLDRIRFADSFRFRIPQLIVHPPKEEAHPEPCISYAPNSTIQPLANQTGSSQVSLYNAFLQLFSALPEITQELPYTSEDESISLFVLLIKRLVCEGDDDDDEHMNSSCAKIIELDWWDNLCLDISFMEKLNIHRSNLRMASNPKSSAVLLRGNVQDNSLIVESLSSNHKSLTSLDYNLSFSPEVALVALLKSILLKTRFGERFEMQFLSNSLLNIGEEGRSCSSSSSSSSSSQIDSGYNSEKTIDNQNQSTYTQNENIHSSSSSSTTSSISSVEENEALCNCDNTTYATYDGKSFCTSCYNLNPKITPINGINSKFEDIPSDSACEISSINSSRASYSSSSISCNSSLINRTKKDMGTLEEIPNLNRSSNEIPKKKSVTFKEELVDNDDFSDYDDDLDDEYDDDDSSLDNGGGMVMNGSTCRTIEIDAPQEFKRSESPILTSPKKGASNEKKNTVPYLELDLSSYNNNMSINLITLLNRKLGHESATFFCGGLNHALGIAGNGNKINPQSAIERRIDRNKMAIHSDIKLKFAQLPGYLVLSFRRKGCTASLEMPIDLDLGHYLDWEHANKTVVDGLSRGTIKTLYWLHGFTTVAEGRFITYTRIRDSSKWYRCVDDVVNSVDLGSRVESKGVVCAIYRLVTKQ